MLIRLLRSLRIKFLFINLKKYQWIFIVNMLEFITRQVINQKLHK